MAAAAVRLAGQLFEDLSEIRVLFVGAGEMIELAATHFAAKKPQGHCDCQPHAGARREAGLPLWWRGHAPGDLPERLHEFDAVISCTASTCPSSAWARWSAR
jgi:glutamyl-tRNA reductase